MTNVNFRHIINNRNADPLLNNDLIFIGETGAESIFPYSWFVTQEPLYSLSSPYVYREYVQGSHHRVHTADRQFDATEGYPWTDGDTYITNKANYDAAYAAYLAAKALPQTLEDAKTYQINKMIAWYNQNVKSKGVTVAGTTYQSTSIYYDNWKNQHDYALRNTLLLTGFYLTDINGAQVPVLSISDLTAIIDTFDRFYWILQQEIDYHTATINAISTTIADVLVYDYTVGWPITPYDENRTFYASYQTSIDADFSIGSPTGTAVGNAIVENGWLRCDFNDVSYVDYSAVDNADSIQAGDISFILKPNYSDTPANDQVLVMISKGDLDYTNRIQLTHSDYGSNLCVTVNDSTGTQIINEYLGEWLPVAGTEYNFGLHYDLTDGNTYLKINGVIFGAAIITTGTRDANIGLLRIGCTWDSIAPTNSNFKMKILSISKE